MYRYTGWRIGWSMLLAAVVVCGSANAKVYVIRSTFVVGDTAWNLCPNATINGTDQALRMVTNTETNKLGAAWLNTSQLDVRYGFDMYFQMMIKDHATGSSGNNLGGGMAFVLQSKPSGASYTGQPSQPNWLGYDNADTVANLVAVEFDDYANATYGETADHIGLNTLDAQTHLAKYDILPANDWSTNSSTTRFVRVIYNPNSRQLDVYYGTFDTDVDSPAIYGGSDSPKLSYVFPNGGAIPEIISQNHSGLNMYKAWFGFTGCTRTTSATSATYQLLKVTLQANVPASDIILDNDQSVPENSGAVYVGTLNAVDEDTGQTYTYVISNDLWGRFTIQNGNELWTNGPFDYEFHGSSVPVDVTVTDNGLPVPLSYTKTFDITITDVNEPPTGMTIDPNPTSVDEHCPIHTLVAKLGTIDPDIWNIFNYTMQAGVGDTHNAYFDIWFDGTDVWLRTVDELDYEKLGGSLSVCIRSSEVNTGESNYIDRTFPITLNDKPDPPGDILVPTPFQVYDDCIMNDVVGQLEIAAATAGPGPYSWALDNSAGGLFWINASTSRFVTVFVTLLGQSQIDAGIADHHDITLTAYNANGLGRTEIIRINVVDRTLPLAMAKDATVTLDSTGSYTLNPAILDAGSWDNVGVTTQSYYRKTGTPPYPLIFTVSCTDVGTPVTIVYRVLDAAGNYDDDEATLTVLNPGPTAICKNASVSIGASGSVTIPPSLVDNGSFAPCGPLTLVTVSPNTFTCAQTGNTPVTLTVRDGKGVTSTATSVVDVQDKLGPNVVCKNISVTLNLGGTASIAPADVNNGTTDNCGTTTLASVIPNSFTCANVGTNTVTLTAIDNLLNTATGTGIVTVREDTPPVVACTDITRLLDGSGNASITAAEVTASASDNCGGGTLTFSVTPNTFTCATAGYSFVTLTATDLSGNTATCTPRVFIHETTPPVAACKNITITLDATGNYTLTGDEVDNGSTDNCGAALLVKTVAPNHFDCGMLGSNSVTLTVADLSGQSNSCSGTVYVQRSTGVIPVCKNITVQLDAAGLASIAPSDVDNGSGMGCGAATLVSVTPSSFDCTNVGANTVTLTVSDSISTTATCTSQVTVLDSLAPTVTCKPVTLNLDATGQATLAAASVTDTSSDNCPGTTYSLSKTSFDCSNLGANTVTLTARDVSGNTATCAASVTVRDMTPPTATGKNVTVLLDAGGAASVAASAVFNNGSDNCGTVNPVSVTPSVFSCANTGANPVTLTVNDGHGNTATCTAQVTVRDTLPPVVQCKAITVNLDAEGSAFIASADVDNGTTDNCGGVTLSVNITTFDCGQKHNTIHPRLTAVDASGNSAYCDASVYVEDPTDSCHGTGPIFVETPPGTVVVDEEDPLVLDVTVTGGEGDITYEWYQDGELIPGADTDELYVPSATTEDGGWYYVCATDETGARRCLFPPVHVIVNENTTVDVPVAGGAELALLAFCVAFCGGIASRRAKK